MGTCDYIDALRARFDIHSDYAIAKKLGVTRQSISGYRSGKHTFSDDLAFQVADLLDLPRAEVYLTIQAERARNAHNEPVLSALTDALHRLGGIAA